MRALRLPRVAAPLRHRDFRLLWLGQTFTLIGTFVSNVAYPFQILQLGGSALELGTLISIYTASNLVFLLVGGAVADRVARRTLIVLTELGSGLVVGILAILGFAGVIQIWHLYVAVAYFGAATAFSVPALGAIVPELVPEEILIPGNAVRGLSLQIGRTGGPIIGGLLVALLGPAAAFAFDAVSFLGSAGLVALTRSRPLEARAASSFFADIREGLAFVFSVQWLWVTIFGFALVNAAHIAAVVVALPLLVTQVIGGGAPMYGVVVAATGVGEAVGAAAIAQVRIRRTGPAMYLFAVVGGVAIALYGLVPTIAGAMTASFLLGISFTCFAVLWMSALQRHVTRNMLGRVTSVDWFGGTLLAPVAPIAAALLVSTVGPAALFVIAGAIVTSLTLAGLLLPSIRRLE
ncbi:MAG TPA: MFS transporter [Candidatus Limnocylindria bacterium]